MTAIEGARLRERHARRISPPRLPAGLVDARRNPARLAYLAPLAAGLLGTVVAIGTILSNATDDAIAPLLLLIAISQVVAVVIGRARGGSVHRAGLAIAVLALIAAGIAWAVPEWTYGGNLNGVVHRTVVSGPLLLALGIAAGFSSTRRLFAGSPSGQDLALAPLFLAPIVIGSIGFALILGRTIASGIATFDVSLLTTAWAPIPGSTDHTIGYLNNILGTFVLIALTLAIAILPGVGAGVFLSEYPGRVARIINFCATMLRAFAVFIIGATASGVVRLSDGLDSSSFLSLLVRGGWDDGTRIQAQKGSFVLAAIFLALLVLPVIARLTEEGLRSVPREMREGSVALGATEGYGLRRILLPWAAPNILTALILAGAEAAGGLAIVMFLATPGQHGVGLFSNVTDLDYAVFASRFGPREYFISMLQYQDTAALLLLVLTVTLTLAAMVLQRRFAKRYRGSVTQ